MFQVVKILNLDYKLKKTKLTIVKYGKYQTCGSINYSAPAA